MSRGRCCEDDEEVLQNGTAADAVDEEDLAPPLRDPESGGLRRTPRARMLSQHQRCRHYAHDLNQDHVPLLHSVSSPTTWLLAHLQRPACVIVVPLRPLPSQ